MSAIQIIIAATTGLFVPPILIVAPVDADPEPRVVVVKSISAEVASEDGKAIEIVVVGEGGDAQTRVVESDGMKTVRVVVEQDDEDDTGALANIMVSVSKHDIEPGGPWLGIRFGPVSKPLASHLQLEAGMGQMVLNIAEGSPADDAGFEQYDVIINIDGAKATDAVGKFLDMVRGFEPDETHEFSLIRGGSPTHATVTIGERPESIGKMKYKFELAPDGLSQDEVHFRGGMLHKDDHGVWSFDRLGDLGNLQNIWECVPEIDGDDLELSIHGKFFPDARRNYMLQLLDKGKGLRIEIEKDDDGQITVTKTTTEDGEETTTTHTYANEEEFEKADPDAFKAHQGCTVRGLYGGVGATPGGLHKMFLFGGPDGLHDLHGLHGFKDLHDITLDIDIDTDHLNDAIGELHKHMSKFKEGRNIFKKKLGEHSEDYSKLDVFTKAHARKATTRFTVDPDGKITVTIRRGDDELVENYDTPQQLKKARPDLYKKYKSLVEEKAE